MTSAKHLIVFGTQDSYANLKQLVSPERSPIGSKVISLTDNNGLFFKVYHLSGTLSERMCLMDLFWGLFSFFFFINDIVNGINSNIRLFADDTSVFIIVEMLLMQLLA